MNNYHIVEKILLFFEISIYPDKIFFNKIFINLNIFFCTSYNTCVACFEDLRSPW